MKHRIHIVASGLLLLMLLSIMPKTFLHDLFANHTDITACNESDIQGPCIHNQGYNCQQTDLVVPSSYICVEAAKTTEPGFVSLSEKVFSPSVLQKFHSSITGRGPPFLV